MKSEVIVTLITSASTIVGGVITYLATKRKYINHFRMREYEHKREVYEKLFTYEGSIVLLAYEQKPFPLLEAVNNAACLSNKTNSKKLLEFYNRLNKATETDVDSLCDEFTALKIALAEELDETFARIR